VSKMTDLELLKECRWALNEIPGFRFEQTTPIGGFRNTYELVSELTRRLDRPMRSGLGTEHAVVPMLGPGDWRSCCPYHQNGGNQMRPCKTGTNTERVK